MPPLLRCAFIPLFILTACVSAASRETVLAVARRRVRLPCRTEAAGQGGAEVCWGRGEPAVFSCQNAVIHTVGTRVAYRKSYRYSVSPSSASLSIFSARTSDSGLYHCRVLLPGLFNDQTATVRLTVTGRTIGSFKLPSATEAPLFTDDANLNAFQPTLQDRFTTESGDAATGPVVARVQSPIKQHRAKSLLGFIGNTMRTSFIIFIPALLLIVAYRFCRTNKRVKTESGLNQTPEEENSV